MLLFTRKEQEVIIIGDGLIKILVSSINGKQVKIGIEAPKEVPIHREEIYKEIKARGGNLLKKNNEGAFTIHRSRWRPAGD